MLEYLQYLIGAVLGLVFGFLFHRLAILQIKKRTNDTVKQDALRKPFILLAWMLLSAILFVAIIFREQELYRRIVYLVFISAAINIAAVDFLIRKIPNELLLLLMVAKIIVLIIDIVNGEDIKKTLLAPVLGLVIGFVLFSVPSMFGIMIGAGDVKYCAVIGFCLGITYYLQATTIMAAALLIYLAYLLITKKGNLKTPAAMGPYLSLGVVLTMIFPIF